MDNEKYIRRGQALIVHDDPESHIEVKKANRHKVGASFQYANSFFASLAAVKSMIHIPYRNLIGMVLEVYKDTSAPLHHHLQKDPVLGCPDKRRYRQSPAAWARSGLR